jgi:aspartate/methionine/tyrosine aminotransferase
VTSLKPQTVRPEILNLPAHAIGDIARQAWAEGGVTPLFFGESDLVTPDFIREAAKRALDEGRTFYAPAEGIAELREAIRAYTERLYNRPIALERVTVPGSAMLAIMLALQCLVRTGDNVVLVAPVWPSITLAAIAAGAQVRFVQLGRDGAGGWRFDLKRVAAACDDKTRAVFVCSPCNPCGWVMTPAEQRELLALTRQLGIALLADEVYARLVFEGEAAPSFLEIIEPDDLVFVINGFSKAWAMTGWRIGWLIAPPLLLKPLIKLAIVSNTGASTFAQYGALAAVTDPRGEQFVRTMRERCAKGRALVEAAARASNRILPFRIDGSFYAYLEIEGVTDSYALAQRLVREAKVGVAPGVAFGPGNDAFIRICFAQDEKVLAPALERLMAAL